MLTQADSSGYVALAIVLVAVVAYTVGFVRGFNLGLREAEEIREIEEEIKDACDR